MPVVDVCVVVGAEQDHLVGEREPAVGDMQEVVGMQLARSAASGVLAVLGALH